MAPEVFTAPVLVLIGPTAIGKTELALTMAHRFDCEIISVDSMQVYKHMDIGTAKPSPAEQEAVRHHLIDIVDPDEGYDAARFVSDALSAIHRVIATGRTPLLTGGTGLYLKALFSGLFDTSEIDKEKQSTIRAGLYERLAEEGREVLFRELEEVDPDTAARLHPNDTHRLIRALEIYQSTGWPWSVLLQNENRKPASFTNLFQIGLRCERELLYERIEQRSRLMLDQGFVAEVEKLKDMGYSPDLQSMQAIGYRHVNNHLAGAWDLETTKRLLVRDTRRYAKRQMTWFAGMPDLRWYDREAGENILHETEQWLHTRHHP